MTRPTIGRGGQAIARIPDQEIAKVLIAKAAGSCTGVTEIGSLWLN